MGKLSVPAVRVRKASRGIGPPLVMVTAYDTPGAGTADAAGVDLLLVGDSVAMVVLGHEDTLSVTVEELAHHTRAVRRASPQALVVSDLPWLSYHLSVEDTLRNAAVLIRAGAQAVKLEGGAKRARMVRALVDAEIPVVGHVGLTPQSIHAMGGFGVQAKSAEGARELVEDALAVEAAGAFAIVLEGVPDVVGRMATEALAIPTIGIGAGPWCDGQVLVYHDVLGLEDRVAPTFVRRYADLRAAAVEALTAFAADVRSGHFPSAAESYHMKVEEVAALGLDPTPQ